MLLDEEELSLKEMKEMAEQAISKETGGYVMTLAEKLRKEGEKRGEAKGLEGTIFRLESHESRCPSPWIRCNIETYGCAIIF